MKAKTTPAPAAAFTFKTNVIYQDADGKSVYLAAGELSPWTRIEDVPPRLQNVIESEAAEEPEGPRGSFHLNTPYEVTDDNRLGRAVRRRVERQIADLEDENARADWIEEEVNSAEWPPEVAAELQDAHDSHVELQRAQAQVDARRSDEVSDAAAAALEPPRLYVKRGSRHYAPAVNARLKAGESVFTRNPEGRFEYIGIVNGDGELPDPPIQL
jgi:hypothetical protein